jgi:N,N-dimethylformamidase
MTKSHDELPVAGYLDRLSARAGERLELRVSVRRAGLCHARLERLISADPNPAGPGLKFEDLSSRLSVTFPARRQPVVLGSCAQAPGPVLEALRAHTWTALILPTLERQQESVILEHRADATRLTMTVGPQGIGARLIDGDVIWQVHTGSATPLHRWSRVWVSLDPEAGRMIVGAHAPAHLYADAQIATNQAPVGGRCPSGGVLTIAAPQDRQTGRSFTGKIEDPAVLSGSRQAWPDPLVSLSDLRGSLVAGWDFSRGVETQAIEPVGPAGLPGRLSNLPMRAVTGARWTGREMCWTRAPNQYGAIRFHEDDLGDCGWSTDVEMDIPPDLNSGAYGFRLTCDDGEDWIPFYALPPRSGERPNIVFLAPTYTYQAYGNHARGNTDRDFEARMAAWGAFPANPDRFPIYGRSTYNTHPDGEGIANVSRLRPLLTMRPGFLSMFDAAGSGLRHYPADSHILAWLDAKAIAYDIVTDEDLDDEGPGILSRYKLLLTGTHPEYHTSGTLDALQSHVRGGGRIAYLGGNGFYWRIARSQAQPWAIELRRAEGGVRRWASEPGEYYNATDGALGGLWRRNGRPPQQIVGVGFSSQGPYAAGCFRRTRESYDPELAWMFNGVDGEVLGDYGLIAGGAAGFELDRYDPRLGSPPGAIVVARSDALPPGFEPVLEDLGTIGYAITGGAPDPLVRADMTYFETRSGGAVFAASAISFCGSLWKDGAFAGPVSRLLENVVRRLSA